MLDSVADERSMPDDYKAHITSIHYGTTKIGVRNDKQSDLLA